MPAVGAVVLFTAINCGRRTVGLTTLDPPDDALALQRRMLATFRCAPDPAHEAVALTPAAAVDDEPAWQGRARGTYLLVTTMPCGDGAVLAYALGPDDTRARSLLARARCAED